MFTPEQFQDRILLYLYDVLDADERRDFESTLAASAEARASLELARARQPLLAEAVKEAFPEVAFVPPVPGTPVPAAPVTATKEKVGAGRGRGVPTRPRRPRHEWTRW